MKNREFIREKSRLSVIYAVERSVNQATWLATNSHTLPLSRIRATSAASRSIASRIYTPILRYIRTENLMFVSSVVAGFSRRSTSKSTLFRIQVNQWKNIRLCYLQIFYIAIKSKGDKIHECSFCKRTFKQAAHLKYHLHSHLKQFDKFEAGQLLKETSPRSSSSLHRHHHQQFNLGLPISLLTSNGNQQQQHNQQQIDENRPNSANGNGAALEEDESIRGASASANNGDEEEKITVEDDMMMMDDEMLEEDEEEEEEEEEEMSEEDEDDDEEEEVEEGELADENNESSARPEEEDSLHANGDNNNDN